MWGKNRAGKKAPLEPPVAKGGLGPFKGGTNLIIHNRRRGTYPPCLSAGNDQEALGRRRKGKLEGVLKGGGLMGGIL